MTCECEPCIQKRRDGARHVSCPRNGRKLQWAWPFIATLIADFQDNAEKLTPEMCEGDWDVYVFTRDMMLVAASSLRTKFKYLDVVPWKFAGSLEKEVAQSCIDQVEARPIHEHNDLTQNIWAEHKDSLRQVAEGGAPTAAHRLLVKRLNDCGLDESGGEGFHRSTNHEKCRAPSSSTVHLKSAIRGRAVVRQMKTWATTYG